MGVRLTGPDGKVPRAWLYGTLFAISMLSLIGGSAILILHDNREVTVDSVRVEGATYLSEEEIIRLAGVQTGRVYIGSDLERFKERLLLHTAIEDANIDMDSRELVIHVNERSCVALVRLEADRSILYEVDSELRVLAENGFRCAGVPLIRGHFEKRMDRFIDPVLIRTLQGVTLAESEYPELAARISEIHIGREGSLMLYLTEPNLRVALYGELDADSLRRLYAVLSYIESNDECGSFIDLRPEEAICRP